MTVGEINALTEDDFAAALGAIFEDSTWVARGAWAQRPFATVEELHRAMAQQVEMASEEDRLRLLRAHPDLGTRARISDASAAEQAGAGLDRLTGEEFERLHRLNKAYRERFGFPFLYAVKDAAKDDIFRDLERRFHAPRDEEFEGALQHVYRIARLRLDDAVSEGG